MIRKIKLISKSDITTWLKTKWNTYIDQYLIMTNISKSKSDQAMKPGQLTKTLKNMAHFYGWGSTASRLQSLFEEAVYFLPLSSQKFQNIT